MRINDKREVTTYVIQSVTNDNLKIVEYLASNPLDASQSLTFDSDFHSATPLTKYEVYHVLDKLASSSFPNGLDESPRKLSVIALTKTATCSSINDFMETELKNYQ